MTLALNNLEDYWRRAFRGSGVRYESPEYVWVPAGQTTDSNCGRASQPAGPFYCPGERRGGPVHKQDRIYVSVDWMYREVFEKFPEHDAFAAASVIAHEVSHHVQHLVGMIREGDQVLCCRLAIRQVELHAECLSGVWARSVYAPEQLDEPSMAAAMAAVATAKDGEDIEPGSSGGDLLPGERAESFRHGYESGSARGCEQAALLPV